MQAITKITGKDNARIVRARRVRDGREPGLIFVEGRRLVEEFLRSGLEILDGFYSEGFVDENLLEQILRSGAPLAELPSKLMASIADTVHPQGVILLARRPLMSTASFTCELAPGQIPLYIFLKEANNPSNIGAIVRTAEAAGALGVFLSPRSADPFSAKALRAAMGSAFRLPIWEGVDLESVVSLAKERLFDVTAADLGATQSYLQADLAKPTLLVFGSEAHGLSGEDIGLVGNRIRIDLASNVESLNLAVAAGIVMFEMRRQRLNVSTA